MQLPREIVVGNETLELIGKICKKLGFSESTLVVTGPHTYHIAGKKVIDILDDDGINVDQLIVSSLTVKDAKIVEEKIKELKPQVVLGIGGGTKIDVAKLGSARQEVPFISIPTTASHDGIASSVVSLRGLNKPYSRVAQSPMAIVVDTSVIIQASHRFAASGCGDVLAKFTAVRDWELAHNAKNEYYGEYAASLSLMGARLVAEHADTIQPEIEEGVRVLLEALISCGVAMSIAGSSRPCSGSEHLFNHALDVISPNSAMHGEQCGVGAIMMARLHGLQWKNIKETLERVGAPTTAEKLGVEPDHVIKALTLACTIRPERYTILNERKLSYEAAEKLARVTGVIE
jgi:glycerol-1-phosphate dehydrogenase [NAD(P)+]